MSRISATCSVRVIVASLTVGIRETFHGGIQQFLQSRSTPLDFPASIVAGESGEYRMRDRMSTDLHAATVQLLDLRRLHHGSSGGVVCAATEPARHRRRAAHRWPVLERLDAPLDRCATLDQRRDGKPRQSDPDRSTCRAGTGGSASMTVSFHIRPPSRNPVATKNVADIPCSRGPAALPCSCPHTHRRT